MAQTRFKWDDASGQFPNGPARVLFFAIDYLKKAKIPDVVDEVWKERGHGGYPYYDGSIELWRSPSAAWNIGDLASRRILVRFIFICFYVRLYLYLFAVYLGTIRTFSSNSVERLWTSIWRCIKYGIIGYSRGCCSGLWYYIG